jgi:TIR domain
MAHLGPHFDPDVFVSYSHGDPLGDGKSPLKDWTHALIKELKGSIQALDTEFDALSIWTDEKIDPTADLTTEIRSKVSGSGVLMIVMSKRYLASSWCHKELDWFREQIDLRASDTGRVFVIRV